MVRFRIAPNLRVNFRITLRSVNKQYHSKPRTFLSFFLYFFSFLSCYFILFLNLTDASSASIPDCEIRASCSQSRKCQYPNQMTVDPSSNVTLNCSIMNGGVTRGMTWNQVKQRVNASDGLVLQQMNSKTGMNSCRCINYTRK